MKKKLDRALGIKLPSFYIQIRYNMNQHDTSWGVTDPPRAPCVWAPYRAYPILDYRDDATVWVWLTDNLCVEMDFNLVQALSDGFREQREEA